MWLPFQGRENKALPQRAGDEKQSFLPYRQVMSKKQTMELLVKNTLFIYINNYYF